MTADWQLNAACLGVPLDMFFNRHRRHEALTYCTRCAVRQVCLEAAMTAEEDAPARAGIYGGTTPGSRASRARVRRQTAGAA